MDGVFDVHCHVGPLAATGTWDSAADQQQRLALFDAYGIRAAAVMPTPQYERPNGARDTSAMNDLVAEYRDSCPDRFPAALGTVEPLHGVAAGVAEIKRMATDLHMAGVVWHHRFQGTWIADSRMDAFLVEMQRLGLHAFVHVFAESTLESPWGLEVLARKYPDMTFVALDAFTSLTRIQELRALGARCPNVLFETAAAFPVGHVIEDFVGSFGSERILFGANVHSSALVAQLPHELTMIRASGLRYEALRNILWDNTARLFHLAD